MMWLGKIASYQLNAAIDAKNPEKWAREINGAVDWSYALFLARLFKLKVKPLEIPTIYEGLEGNLRELIEPWWRTWKLKKKTQIIKIQSENINRNIEAAERIRKKQGKEAAWLKKWAKLNHVDGEKFWQSTADTQLAAAKWDRLLILLLQFNLQNLKAVLSDFGFGPKR